LANGFNKVTAADETKSVILPTPTDGGDLVLIHNAVAHNLPVYPHSGGKINDGSADAAQSLPSSAGAIYVALDATNWYAIPSTPS
jgi:hypothetical protein